MSNENKKLDKALIGAAIGFLGMGACLALALLMQLVQPHLPGIRQFILWALEPQLAIGMAIGIAWAMGLMWCLDARKGGEL